MKAWNPPWTSLPPVASVPRRFPIPPREIPAEERERQRRTYERTHLAAVERTRMPQDERS